MKRKAKALVEQAGGSFENLKEETIDLINFLGELAAGCMDAIRHPRKIRWNDTFVCMNTCGADGLPITLLICLLTGIILGYQSAVQMHKYGADTFLPALVGCAMVRELVPLMTAIIVTGRSGSAFAAEIGTMKVSEEVNAMRTMGLDPIRFLVIPKLIAMMCMIPLLAILGNIAGILGGLIVGRSELGMPVEIYMETTFVWVKMKFLFESIIKSVIFGVIITVVSCWRGFRTGNDAIAVGRATTSTVVLSILMIVITDAFLANFFNTLFYK